MTPRLPQLHWLFRPDPSTAMFAARTTLAALAALFLSILLQLDEPKWSMMTVFIVAQPLSGMVMAKSAARFTGTLVAATVAIALIAGLSQSPPLFVGMLALWLSVCVFLATLFRNFRSYAFVLSGYTAAIIAVPATQDPGTILTFAVARSSEITLGILCAGLSSMIFAPRSAGRNYFTKLDGLFSSIGDYLSRLTSQESHNDDNRLRTLINDVLTLETLRGYARYDTPGFRARARLAGRLNSELIALLTAAFTVQEYPVMESAIRRAVKSELQPVGRLLSQGKSGDSAETKQTLTRAYERILAIARLPGKTRNADEWVLISRLLDLANRTHAAVTMRDLLQSEDDLRGQPPAKSFATELDFRMALRNAGRTIIAIAFTGVAWLYAAPGSDEIAMLLVAVFITLFATRDQPVAVILPFAKGAAYAIVAGFIYAFYLLPAVTSFPLLVVTLFPILFAGSLAKANPATAGTGTAFLILFTVLLNASNGAGQNAASFLNDSLGMGLAIIVVLLSFLLLWPAAPDKTVQRLLSGMFHDLATGFNSPRHVFETRMYDRLVRLLPHLDSTRGKDEKLLQGALATITLGVEGRWLRVLLRNREIPDDIRSQCQTLLERIATFFATPPAAAGALAPLIEEADQLGGRILQQAEPLRDRNLRRLLVRTGVTARITAATLGHNEAFFLSRGRPNRTPGKAGAKSGIEQTSAQ